MNEMKKMNDADVNRMVNLLKGSTLFDPNFYLSNYHDVAVSGIDPYLHYICCGFSERRLPSSSLCAKLLDEFYENPNNTLPDMISRFGNSHKTPVLSFKIPKIACLVLGDSNIRYKDIVTLVSVKQHNLFDLFTASTGSSPDNKYLDYLNKYGINYLPFKKEIIDYISGFKVSGKWPPEMLARFYFPFEFYAMGFDYLIIIDYDMLCLRPYNLKDIISSPAILRGIYINTDPNQFPTDMREILNDKWNFPPPNYDKRIYNGGFLVFNLEKYAISDFYMKYQKIYNDISPYKHPYAVDELVLGVVRFIYNTESMDSSYNMVPANISYDRKNSVINIHYGWHHPWNLFPITTNKLKKDLARYHHPISLLLHMLDYVEYVRQFEFADKVFQNGIPSRNQIYNAIIDYEKIYESGKLPRELA